MYSEIIAVIDDNQDWVENVSEALTQQGFEVRTAQNECEAIDLLDGIRPDLLILDVHLAGINGLRILSDFRNHNRTTPVLVVSGDDRASIRDKAMTDGASGFLQKPLPSSLLVRAVRRFLKVPKHSSEIEDSIGSYYNAELH